MSQERNSVKFDYHQIGDIVTRTSQRYQRTENVVKYAIKHNLGSFQSPMEVSSDVNEMFGQIMEPHLVQAKDDDIISVAISGPNLPQDIFIPPQRKQYFRNDRFLTSIFNVSQSNTEFLLDGEFYFTIAITKNSYGGKGAPKTLDERSKSKRSVITIDNNDNNCFFRALFVSMFHLNKPVQHHWRNVREDKNKAQTIGAQKLASECKWKWNIPVYRTDMPSIQAQMQEHQIIVLDAHDKHNLIYRGPERSKKLYVEFVNRLDGGHYNAVINIKGYMGQSYYCADCHIAYSVKFRHNCTTSCKQCTGSSQHDGKVTQCLDCGRNFNGLECYDYHLACGFCQYRKKCPTCQREYRHHVQHDCDMYYCRMCGEEYKEQPHYCFIKPTCEANIKEQDQQHKTFVIYDIESTQIDNNGIRRHVPNLLVCNTVCDSCPNECEGYQTFKGTDCIKRFGDYLYGTAAKRAEAKGGTIIAFAHNARGYDAHFVLQDLWTRNFENPQVIMSGRKILRITVGNIKFIDSLAFFLQPLSSLPKAFGLDNNLVKGHFPHWFNEEKNYEYIGLVPPIQYYDSGFLNTKTAQELRAWHQDQLEHKYQFSFWEELIKYCKNDVEILTKSVLAFRKHFKEITGLDPYTRCFTLASIGMETFRAKLLKHQQLAITPHTGYGKGKPSSYIASAWLDLMEKEHGQSIIREYKVGRYFADGCIPQEKHVFEFFGCHWHDCPCQRLSSPKYEKTKEKIAYFQRLGYQVTYMWECQLKADASARKFIQDRTRYYRELQHHGGCDIKEAFFGGRTNNLKFYHEATEEESIKYVDFCSLYPYVLKTKTFPTGHPMVIRQNFDYSLDTYFGFVKCAVLPPRQLYLPVLPLRTEAKPGDPSKLVFPLCGKCANDLASVCTHDNQERLLINTWTTEELKEAIKRGYVITKIFEVYHYEDVSNSIFREYINMWLKIKQQASGWPRWCNTTELKEKYIENYLTREGIQLDYDTIEKNEALRFIAKIMLNSFWGKLAQRRNQPKTEMIPTYHKYIELATDPKKTIKGEILMPTENLLMVSWHYTDENDADIGKTNIAVSSYVTAYARLELFWLMERIENIRSGSVLYHDTDSVIYIQKNCDLQIDCGDFLGDLTDEIEKDYPGGRCTKFVSLGPKNYAYQVTKADGSIVTHMKVKGLTLNEQTLNIVDFDKMVSMATAYVRGEMMEAHCPQQQITSDVHHNLWTREFLKIYRATSNKRVIDGNSTLPYGYIKT